MTSSQGHTKYLDVTKGMRKSDRMAFLMESISSSENDFHVHFGSYYQFVKNKKGDFIKEPISWKVMNHRTFKEDNYLLLLSEHLLDSCPFSFEGNCYETSIVREDLNDYFHNLAFTKKEQKRMVPIVIDNHEDRVFLLSREDYMNPDYFTDDMSRRTGCTDYARKNGGFHCKRTQSGTYWTRSRGPGKSPTSVTIINHNGAVTSWYCYHRCRGWYHSFCHMAYETIRPAIRIKI
jgi:hypothetical protein